MYHISIHALLAESDIGNIKAPHFTNYFYPRSPCGERLLAPLTILLIMSIFLSTLSLRRATSSTLIIGFSAGVFLSTLSLRRATILCVVSVQVRGFLSTLSLRRATWYACSIAHTARNFYPRSPCGERLIFMLPLVLISLFLSTLSLRRAT